jgi:hypothetical protein
MSLFSRKRKCSTEKDFDPLDNKSKQICLFIEQEEYDQIVQDPQAFRQYLDRMIEQYPELFPATTKQGYKLHDILPESKKMPGICLRRIALVVTEGDTKPVFTIRPSFVLPYMMGYTNNVEKALFLRQWVPYWALTHAFGQDDKYWQRLNNRLGRNSVVGTTVKDPNKLPADLLSDEKHTRINGEKAYIATTVGVDCVLGASVSLSADDKNLKEAYGHFKTEARNVNPKYEPKTVNTDGWSATQAAWRALFSTIVIILCFLHSFIKIRNRCKRMKDHYPEIRQRVWEAYHADTPDAFHTKIVELQVWALETLPEGAGLDAVLKLCGKESEFVKAYAHPTACRTSNMIDRHMEPMNRYLDGCRYFHGHLMTAEYGVRAWALLHNFRPYCPRASVADQYQSPAHKLNGFVYHDNWLHNLLISASMGGYRQ